MKLKQLRSNLVLKILAVFLAGIMAVLMFFSVADALIVTAMIENHGTYEMSRRYIANNFLYNISENVSQFYDVYNNDTLQMYEDANFYYEIYDNDGNLLDSNYNGEEFWFCETSHTYLNHTVTLYVKNDLKQTDNMALALSVFDFAFKWRNVSVAITLISVLSLIILLTFLFCSAGHKAGVDGISLNIIDKIPLEIYLSFFVFAIILELWFLDFFTYDVITIAFVCIFGLVDFMLLIGFSMSVATRIKSRTLFSNTVLWIIISFVYKILKRIFKTVKYLFSNLSLIWKTSLLVLLIFSVDALFFISGRFDVLSWSLFQFLEKIIILTTAILVAIQFKDIQKAIKRVSKGEVEYRIDTQNHFWDFKECAEDLNNIGLGLSNAVDEKMKSERFKTELITNVSHDIKTPLTSIINYVDLIKKEPLENQKVSEYIEVLDRQSRRLKKLTDDLVEASKASSGVINVELKKIDLSVLLVQAVGEYQEKMDGKSLQMVVSYPDEPVNILADGRYLWRVFDNLMNNIVKYAQEGTRVYLTVEIINQNAVATFKNISKEQLNLNGEELTERFVRGDSSRNTEGSGLGLSIARSLTELQNGDMKILVDGDLYKVSLSFKLCGEEVMNNEQVIFNTKK